MRTYRTQTGSIYDIDGLMVRRRERSSRSNSERVSNEWRQALSIEERGVGLPIVIVWGHGKDEHSDDPRTVLVGVDDDSVLRTRTTVTSPVVEELEPPPIQ